MSETTSQAQASTRFMPRHVPSGAIAAAARRYIGLEYSEVTAVNYSSNGVPHGTANCFGVLLLAARDLELLPADFDLNLSPSNFGGARVAKTLWRILHENFDQVPHQNEDGTPNLQIDDVLLFRWADVDTSLSEPHHVALHLGFEPHEPYGSMLHALEWEAGGGDSIFVQRLSTLDWRRLDSVHRLKAEFRPDRVNEDRVLDVVTEKENV